LAKERFLLRLPIIGNIIIERGVTHFCQTAAMLLQSGLHITQVMDIATETNKNPIIRKALRGVRDRLVQGEGLSQPLTDEPLFPPLLGEMALVGEKTGTMDTTLATLADYYEQRVDRRIESLTGMLEPLLTFAVGLVIIFIALSIMTPLYSILKQIN
jgi:type IV pilus assembly protein PilC